LGRNPAERRLALGQLPALLVTELLVPVLNDPRECFAVDELAAAALARVNGHAFIHGGL
jgi:hypothetical protein